MRYAGVGLCVLILLAGGQGAAAMTDEERGLEIALERDRRESGFQDQTATLTMILTNRHGQESTRELRSFTLEVEGDGDKSLILFDAPRDIQGTALLTYTHKTGPDDQWLFLPALNRVKRIASNNKSGPFMGSEFSYEDIASQEVEKYTYRLLREEPVDGRTCYVLEYVPVDERSGYTRQIVWIDQETYRPEKVEYYDRKESLLKTLTFDGYRQYLGRYWRADVFHMVNHQTGKATKLLWKDYRLQTGLTERDFDQSALRRVR